jgi:hypothetical protein
MKQKYPDILNLNPHPSWWDENGTPRYAFHHPSLCPNINADIVALISIECQSCRSRFLVQVSGGRQLWHATGHELREYGDPPPHDDCLSGDAMMSIPITMYEYWKRIDGEWMRVLGKECRDIRPEWSKKV